jgi:isopenicillin-N N-acyltransferase-like protein
MQQFPFIQVSGSSEEIGEQHGSLLADKIAECYEVYVKTWSSMDRAKVVDFQSWGHYFAGQLRSHLPDYAREIEAIASSARLPAWQLYALNGRSEIYNDIVNKNKITQAPSECTALYFAEAGILGENWDWIPELEQLSVVMQITREDSPQILMVTEPGIIGKIGLNSAGVGVCLNMLNHPGELRGIPIHVLLRVALDAPSVASAYKHLKQLPRQTCSNFLLADAKGYAIDIEFAMADMNLVEYADAIYLHTNHYLSKAVGEPKYFQSSLTRFHRAEELMQQKSRKSVADMQVILADQAEAAFPICREYKMSDNFVVGTVSSIVMDLPKRQLHCTPGNPLRHDYRCYDLHSN